jgi:hypothetical protein
MVWWLSNDEFEKKRQWSNVRYHLVIYEILRDSIREPLEYKSKFLPLERIRLNLEEEEDWGCDNVLPNSHLRERG